MLAVLLISFLSLVLLFTFYTFMTEFERYVHHCMKSLSHIFPETLPKNTDENLNSYLCEIYIKALSKGTFRRQVSGHKTSIVII